MKEDPADPFLHYALAVEEAHSEADSLIPKLEALKARFPDYLPIYDRLAREYLTLDDEVTSLSNAKAALRLAEDQGNAIAIREMRGLVEELSQ